LTEDRTFPPLQLNRDLQMVKFGANYKFESGLPDTVTPSTTVPSADPSEHEDLAKKSQNPIADLVSVPFQSNTNFNAGPFNRTQEVLNIQPVVPLHINADWNLISRTIMPVISRPSPIFNSNTNGIGDITQEFFLTPSHPPASQPELVVDPSLIVQFDLKPYSTLAEVQFDSAR
jgi:hypothetical protein